MIVFVIGFQVRRMVSVVDIVIIVAKVFKLWEGVSCWFLCSCTIRELIFADVLFIKVNSIFFAVI